MEWVALKDLAKDKNITKKPADIGGAIVILNTVDYIKEAERQLGVKDTYREMPRDPIDEYNQEVDSYLEKMVETGEIHT